MGQEMIQWEQEGHIIPSERVAQCLCAGAGKEELDVSRAPSTPSAACPSMGTLWSLAAPPGVQGHLAGRSQCSFCEAQNDNGRLVQGDDGVTGALLSAMGAVLAEGEAGVLECPAFELGESPET